MPVYSKDEKLNFTIREFCFSRQLLEYGYYLVVGKPRSGKTTVTRLIAQHFDTRNTAQAVVIAGNPNIRKCWAEIVHPMYILDGFTLLPDSKGRDMNAEVAIAALDGFIKEQNRRIAFCEAENVEFPEEWKVNLFIDDCGSMSKFMRSAQMKWLVSNRRQILCNVFVCVQKWMQAAPESREGSDGAICLQTGNEDTVKGLHKNYCSTVAYRSFETVFSAATENRGMLIIDAHPEKNILQHMVYFSHCDLLHDDGYKGKLERLGSAMHWEEAAKKYKPPKKHIPRESLLQQPATTATACFESKDEDSDQEKEFIEKVPVVPHFTGKPFENGPNIVHFARTTMKPPKKI